MSKPFLRLGEYERRILLSVGPDPSVIPNRPPRPGKQAYESHHLAITRLHQIGLIDFGREQVDTEWYPNVERHSLRSSRPRPYVYRREIYLTPFGQVVVEMIRPVLESGDWIRWKKYLPKLLEPGNQLLRGFDRFKSALVNTDKCQCGVGMRFFEAQTDTMKGVHGDQTQSLRKVRVYTHSSNK